MLHFLLACIIIVLLWIVYEIAGVKLAIDEHIKLMLEDDDLDDGDEWKRLLK
jgi:cell division protein FtsL